MKKFGNIFFDCSVLPVTSPNSVMDSEFFTQACSNLKVDLSDYLPTFKDISEPLSSSASAPEAAKQFLQLRAHPLWSQIDHSLLKSFIRASEKMVLDSDPQLQRLGIDIMRKTLEVRTETILAAWQSTHILEANSINEKYLRSMLISAVTQFVSSSENSELEEQSFHRLKEKLHATVDHIVHKHIEDCKKENKRRFSLRGNSEIFDAKAYEAKTALRIISKLYQQFQVDQSLMELITTCTRSSSADVALEALITVLNMCEKSDKASIITEYLKVYLPDTSSEDHVSSMRKSVQATHRKSIVGSTISSFSLLNSINISTNSAVCVVGKICVELSEKFEFASCVESLVTSCDFQTLLEILSYTASRKVDFLFKLINQGIDRVVAMIDPEDHISYHAVFRTMEALGKALIKHQATLVETEGSSIIRKLKLITKDLICVVTQPSLYFSGLKALTWLEAPEDIGTTWDQVFQQVTGRSALQFSWKRFHITAITRALIERCCIETTLLSHVPVILEILCCRPDLFEGYHLFDMFEEMVTLGHRTSAIASCVGFLNRNITTNEQRRSLHLAALTFICKHTPLPSQDSVCDRSLPRQFNSCVKVLFRNAIAEHGDFRRISLQGLACIALKVSDIVTKLELYHFFSKLARYKGFGIEGFCNHIANRLDQQIVGIIRQNKSLETVSSK